MPRTLHDKAPLSVRTLFVSDLHLGAAGNKAENFLRFLQGIRSASTYLVGDILDIWHGARIEWGWAQKKVMQELRDRAESAVRTIYLPGNHDRPMSTDEQFRDMGFEVALQHTHTAADGKKYAVFHGDCCDRWPFRSQFATSLGARCNHILRNRLPGSGAATGTAGRDTRLVTRFNRLMTFGNRFEARAVAIARKTGHDGVICGHSHIAALHHRAGLVYANCGDWTDNMTALVEDWNGRLQLLFWDVTHQRAAPLLPRPVERLAA